MSSYTRYWISGEIARSIFLPLRMRSCFEGLFCSKQLSSYFIIWAYLGDAPEIHGWVCSRACEEMLPVSETFTHWAYVRNSQWIVYIMIIIQLIADGAVIRSNPHFWNLNLNCSTVASVASCLLTTRALGMETCVYGIPTHAVTSELLIAIAGWGCLISVRLPSFPWELYTQPLAQNNVRHILASFHCPLHNGAQNMVSA